MKKIFKQLNNKMLTKFHIKRFEFKVTLNSKDYVKLTRFRRAAIDQNGQKH